MLLFRPNCVAISPAAPGEAPLSDVGVSHRRKCLKSFKLFPPRSAGEGAEEAALQKLEALCQQHPKLYRCRANLAQIRQSSPDYLRILV